MAARVASRSDCAAGVDHGDSDLVDDSPSEQPVVVSGLPGGRYRRLLSTAASVGEERESLSAGASVRLSLPAESLTLLTTLDGGQG